MTREQREASYILPKAGTIKALQLTLAAVTPNNNVLALVVYGTNLGSIIGWAHPSMRWMVYKPPPLLGGNLTMQHVLPYS